MSDIQIFKSKEFGQVRIIMINSEPYFVGKDIADSLGYSETNAMTKRLDEDEFISDKVEGMNMKSILINESGLYNAILGSKLPGAKKFRKWITGEILPSIRKHGAYMTDDTLEKALTSPDFLIKLATEIKTERAARVEAEKKVQVMKPKAEFYDDVAGSKDAISIGEVAKVLGIKGLGRNNLFSLLRSKKVLQNNNQPYQTFVDRGYFRVLEQKWTTPNGDTKINVKTLVYQKGLDYIRKVVNEN